MGAFGIVLTAGYILWMIQRIMFGSQNQNLGDVTDATPLELVPVALMIVAIMVVGIYPAVIADVFSSGVQPIADALESAVAAASR